MDSLNTTCLANGLPSTSIDTGDRGFAYGDGVFETMLQVNGIIPFLTLHLDRLQHSCDRLGISLDIGTIHKTLVAFSHNQEDGENIIKLTVTRGVGARGYQPKSSGQPTVVMQAFQKITKACDSQPKSLQLTVATHRLPINKALAGMKHLSCLDYVLASRQWQDTKFDDGLLLDYDDKVIESSTKNLFLVTNGQLATPDLSGSGVSGIGRRLILEKYCAELGLTVDVKQLTLSDLLRADEVMLCNSITGVAPVASIDDQIIVNRSDITTRLHSLWQSDIRSQVLHAR